MSKILDFIDNSVQTSGLSNLSNYDTLVFVLEYKTSFVAEIWKFKFLSFENCGSRRHPIYKNSIQRLETKKIISTNLKYSEISDKNKEFESKTLPQLFTILNNPKVLILINRQSIVSKTCTKCCSVFSILVDLEHLFKKITPEYLCEKTNILWT